MFVTPTFYRSILLLAFAIGPLTVDIPFPQVDYVGHYYYMKGKLLWSQSSSNAYAVENINSLHDHQYKAHTKFNRHEYGSPVKQDLLLNDHAAL